MNNSDTLRALCNEFDLIFDNLPPAAKLYLLEKVEGLRTSNTGDIHACIRMARDLFSDLLNAKGQNKKIILEWLKGKAEVTKDKAEVTASFAVSKPEELRAWMKNAGVAEKDADEFFEGTPTHITFGNYWVSRSREGYEVSCHAEKIAGLRNSLRKSITHDIGKPEFHVVPRLPAPDCG